MLLARMNRGLGGGVSFAELAKSSKRARLNLKRGRISFANPFLYLGTHNLHVSFGTLLLYSLKFPSPIVDCARVPFPPKNALSSFKAFIPSPPAATSQHLSDSSPSSSPKPSTPAAPTSQTYTARPHTPPHPSPSHYPPPIFPQQLYSVSACS